MSDNGPQYASVSFSHFASEYGFDHVTSSPGYPQSNGAAERAVKTVKSLLTKNDDPYVALLAYRSTPPENGYSPAELLMGHRLCTMVPVHSSQLIPRLPRASQLHEKEKIRETAGNFDKRHRASDLTPLQPGNCVWIPDSPEELLMGRRLCTMVPVHSSQLIPCLPRASQLREKEKKIRGRQQRNFDK